MLWRGERLNAILPGQYFDKETNLHYNYFRDYDPSTGRYVQADPIGIAGGINLYQYTNSNPVSFTDPLGLTTTVPGFEGQLPSVGFGGGGYPPPPSTNAPQAPPAAPNIWNNQQYSACVADCMATKQLLCFPMRLGGGGVGAMFGGVAGALTLDPVLVVAGASIGGAAGWTGGGYVCGQWYGSCSEKCKNKVASCSASK